MTFQPITHTATPFAARLKALRAQRGWSQVQLATCAGMNVHHIQHLEAGRGEPCFESLRRLAWAFSLSIAELCEGVG